MKAIGITATDTDIGKTIISGALASVFNHRGYKTGIFKPVASGCKKCADGKLLSTDAFFLLHSLKRAVDYQDDVVPYVFEHALAPSEASKLEGVEINTRIIEKKAKKKILTHDITVIEGVGGISTPITEDYLVKDFFKELNIPIVIIVKPILGNVNHAVLTAEYAKNHGLKVLGFIVNSWNEKTSGILENSNLYYYEKLTGLPILGKMPMLSSELLTGEKNDELSEIAEKNIEINKILELLGGGFNE